MVGVIGKPKWSSISITICPTADAAGSITLTSPNREFDGWWSTLTITACSAIRLTLLPERSRLPESKKKTRCGSTPCGGSDRMLSKPGRNMYICGSGGGMSTHTSFPAARSASAKARLQPRVSPSASL